MDALFIKRRFLFITGSLQTKNNKYYIVINYYDENKKRKQKWIKTNLEVRNNKKKADKLLQETLNRYNNSNTIYTDITFIDFMDKWLNTHKEQIRPITYELYSLQIEKHIKPFFGSVKLQDLSPFHIQDYYDTKINSGLSACTVLKHHANIHSCLKYALNLNLIPYNPADRVILPKKEPFRGSYYNNEQLKQLFKCSKGDILEDLIYITALYGLRRSEVLGLKWQAIDFEKKTICICHTGVQGYKNMIYTDDTKTHSSYRTLPLTADAENRLLNLKRKQAQYKLMFGNSYKNNDYVFKREDGTLLNGNYVTKHFSDILKNNNLPHIRFHDLRHSAASMFIALGFSLKEVQEFLGHSNISTTADIYAHLQYEAKTDMAEKLNKVIAI